MKYNIGIDLGGTNIKVGLVDENYNIVAKATCKTDLPRPAEEIADSIAETVWKALNDAKVTIDELNSIGIGTPGTASRDTGVVLYSCNLGFRNTDLRSLIGARLGKQVYVENDANAAAFGEVLAGAGKGCRDVVVVTLGTWRRRRYHHRRQDLHRIQLLRRRAGTHRCPLRRQTLQLRTQGLLRGVFLRYRAHQHDQGSYGSRQVQQDVGDMLRRYQ